MVHIGISLPFSVRSPQHFQACVVLLKDFFNQIYQSKDFLRLTYFKVSTFLHTGPSSKKCMWSPNILNQIAQSLIKITQKTSINAIGVDGIKFSNKETEFFNFWFTPPFGEATINKKRDQVLLIRYFDQHCL